MAWTLALILCIAAYFIVVLFNNTFHIFQRKAFVYPSEAEIDQMLPPEIVETIMTYTDLDTLFSCELVSKYWRHHAKKKSVVKDAIQKEMSIRMDLSELLADVGIQPIDVDYLTYDDSYKLQWHLVDRRFVEKRGKKLMDLQYHSFKKIREALQRLPYAQSCQLQRKYIIRTRMHFVSGSHRGYTFICERTSELIRFHENFMPRHIIDNLYPRAVIEIVEDLSNLMDANVIRIANPAHARIIETRNLFGSVPVNGDLFGLMYLLFTPCILKDLWNTSDNTRYYINVITAYIGLMATIALSLFLVINECMINVRGTVREAPTKRKIRIGVGGIIILTIVCYKWTMEFGFYCAIEALIATYGMLIFEMVTERHPIRNGMLFISFCLVVSIVDWKSTVDAVRSGDIWLPLLYNLMQHLFISAFALLVLFVRETLASEKVHWKSVLDLDNMFIRTLLILSVVGVVLITSVDPYNTIKIRLL